MKKCNFSDGSAIVEVYQSGDVYNDKIVWFKNPTEVDFGRIKDWYRVK